MTLAAFWSSAFINVDFPVPDSPRTTTFPDGIDLLEETEFKMELHKFCSGDEGRDCSIYSKGMKSRTVRTALPENRDTPQIDKP